MSRCRLPPLCPPCDGASSIDSIRSLSSFRRASSVRLLSILRLLRRINEGAGQAFLSSPLLGVRFGVRPGVGQTHANRDPEQPESPAADHVARPMNSQHYAARPDLERMGESE